jgi:catechol 2,3-dioxygenase-like lactoylglutathione lyase family enzyme
MKLSNIITISGLCLLLAPCVLAQSEFSSGTISIGVIVSDLEKSLNFYTEVLGMQKTGGFNIEEPFAKSSGLSNGIPFSVTTLKLWNENEATQWKLMTFGKDVKHRKSKYIQDDLGMQYITIFVSALKPFIQRIKEHNIPLLGETPVSLGGDTQFILIQDPDGTFIELIGPME